MREELHTEVERILNDVCAFKIHIQTKLEDYEMFVDDEVNREVQELEQAEKEEAEAGAQDDEMDESMQS